MSTCPILVVTKAHGLLRRNQTFDIIMTFFNDDIISLIMMQKGRGLLKTLKNSLGNCDQIGNKTQRIRIAIFMFRVLYFCFGLSQLEEVLFPLHFGWM